MCSSVLTWTSQGQRWKTTDICVPAWWCTEPAGLQLGFLFSTPLEPGWPLAPLSRKAIQGSCWEPFKKNGCRCLLVEPDSVPKLKGYKSYSLYYLFLIIQLRFLLSIVSDVQITELLKSQWTCTAQKHGKRYGMQKGPCQWSCLQVIKAPSWNQDLPWW